MAINYSTYLNFLKNRNVIAPCYKVELLDASENPRYEITKDILATGSINAKINNGIRRTASITIANDNNKYKIAPGEIFYGSKLRLSVGILIEDEEYYETLGTFYIQEISPNRGPSNETISLSLVDKWGKLDGTIFGKLLDRVEFNKSITVYKNTSITYNSGVSSAALNGTEFTNNNPNYIATADYPLGSAIFTNATSGVKNKIVFRALGPTATPASLKFKYVLSNFSLSFEGGASNQSIGTFEIQLNDSLSANENTVVKLYENIDGRGKISINNEIYDISVLLGDTAVRHPLKTNAKISLLYSNSLIQLLYNDKPIITKEVTLPEQFYLYLNYSSTVGGISYPSLTINSIYMDSTSFLEYFDYNIYEIIRNILKKNTRYDIRTIAYLPAYFNGQSTSQEINEWLYLKIDNLSDIEVNRDCVVATGDGTVFRCITNEANMAPEWAPYLFNMSDIIDIVEPLLDSYYEPLYLRKTTNEQGRIEYIPDIESNSDYVQIYDEMYEKRELPFGMLTLPKSITEERGSTESNIITNLAELLSAEVGYNRYGQFFLRPTDREIIYAEQEVIWRFAYQDYYFSRQDKVNYSNIINCVIVTSSVIDGSEISVFVANEDPESNFCIQRIGTIPYIYKLNYSYNPDDWIPEGWANKTDVEKREKGIEEIRKNMASLAEWYLQRNKLLQASVDITCPLIPHLEEGKIIELENENGEYKKYLINSFSIPFSYNGAMSINCTEVS